MGQEKYGDCIKSSFQTNSDESSHIIEKLRKVDETTEFEYEHHIELRMELVRQVDEAGSHIKGKYSLINQMEIKVREIEE